MNFWSNFKALPGIYFFLLKCISRQKNFLRKEFEEKLEVFKNSNDGSLKPSDFNKDSFLEAEEIDAESKFKVLNDFLSFVKENPDYENELMEVAELFSTSEGSPDIFQKIGEYFLLKGLKPNALKFFELGIAEDIDNYELVKSSLLLQLDLGKFEEAATLSEKALEIFPAQPLLYLIRGTALNQLKNYKEAEEILTFGLDFIIEDQKLQADFYEQLYLTYTGLGNPEKAAEFSKKAGGIK